MIFLEANDMLGYFSVTTGGKILKLLIEDLLRSLSVFYIDKNEKLVSFLFVNIEIYAVCIKSWEHYSTVAHKSV